MTDAPARFVTLEGCVNFRDLGGYPTADGRRLRHGWVYRSDALHYLTPADVAHVRDALGVRDVIDLRSTAEVDTDGPGPLATPPVRRHHLPLFDVDRREVHGTHEVRALDETYALMLRFAMRPVSRALELIAAGEGATVFHCAAGKDRTGVVAAVLLGALGVPDEHIVADYALTRHALDRITARLRASESYRYIFTELPPETLHAEPHTMERLLASVRAEYGDLGEYARRAGVGDALLARLRERALER
jgi:protein-tyrosine phosphatase